MSHLTQQKYIEKATIIHKGKYDYSEIVYINGKTLLLLMCPIHKKSFTTTAENHTHNKGGCSICRYDKASEKQAGSKESFIKRATNMYGDSFDYSNVVYKTAKVKINIKCREHNCEFSQTPDKHFSGNGCGVCVKNGYNKSKNGFLYVLSCKNLIKIGITNREVSLRELAISKSSKKKFEIILKIKFSDGSVPMNVETELLKSLRVSHRQPTDVFDGSTECFLDLNIDYLTAKIVLEINKTFKQGIK